MWTSSCKHPLIQEVAVTTELGGKQTLNSCRDIKCNILKDCLNEFLSQLRSNFKNNMKLPRLQKRGKNKRTKVLDAASGLRRPMPSSLNHSSDHGNLRGVTGLRVKTACISLN